MIRYDQIMEENVGHFKVVSDKENNQHMENEFIQVNLIKETHQDSV